MKKVPILQRLNRRIRKENLFVLIDAQEPTDDLDEREERSE